MTNQPAGAGTQDLGALIVDISREARVLLVQQLELARAEVGQELRRAGTAAAEVAGGGGLVAAGGLLTGFAAAHLIRSATGLPLWLCYAAAAGGLGAGGALLLRKGRDGFAGLRPLPETAAAVGENLEWLKNQLTPAGG